MKQVSPRPPRGLLFLVAFAIVIPGAILGTLSLSGLEGDRLAREKLLEERHGRLAEGIALRLGEAVEEKVGEVEAEVEALHLEEAGALPALRAELDLVQDRLPAVQLFFVASGEDWSLVLPELPEIDETGSLSVWKNRLEELLREGDLKRRTGGLLDLYARSSGVGGSHSGAIFRNNVARALEASLRDATEERLEEEASRFLQLNFQDRYTREICDQLRETRVGPEGIPARWDTAAREGNPILYGLVSLPGHEPPFLLGFVLELDWLIVEVLPGLVAASTETGVRIGIRDQGNRRLAGVSPGDFLPTALSLGMGLPRWTIEVGGDRSHFERRYRTRKGILLGLITLLAVAIFGGAAWTVRGVTREMEAARQKSDFVASVSHELRTPLTSIRMFADMIRSGRAPTPEKRTEYARIISRESERLGSLINNVLDFSRLEEGKAVFERSPTPVGEVVKSTVEKFREHLLEEGYPLETRIDEGLPTLSIDPEAISRAVQNLLGNAVKYAGEDKRIRVTAGLHGEEVRIEVEDHGPGIPARELERIFEKFYRGRETRQTGCGLGLAIVRAIIEGHGGAVSVHSREGKGSTFRLSLPVPSPGRSLGPPGHEPL